MSRSTCLFACLLVFDCLVVCVFLLLRLSVSVCASLQGKYGCVFELTHFVFALTRMQPHVSTTNLPQLKHALMLPETKWRWKEAHTNWPDFGLATNTPLDPHPIDIYPPPPPTHN